MTYDEYKLATPPENEHSGESFKYGFPKDFNPCSSCGNNMSPRDWYWLECKKCNHLKPLKP
jgi:hypothetical protein